VLILFIIYLFYFSEDSNKNLTFFPNVAYTILSTLSHVCHYCTADNWDECSIL